VVRRGVRGSCVEAIFSRLAVGAHSWDKWIKGMSRIIASEPTIEKRREYTDQRGPRRCSWRRLQGRGGKLTPRARRRHCVGPSARRDRARPDGLLLKSIAATSAPTEQRRAAFTSSIPSFENGETSFPFRERMAALGQRLWKGFTFLFKIAIVGNAGVSYFNRVRCHDDRASYFARRAAAGFRRRRSGRRFSEACVILVIPGGWGGGPSPRLRPGGRVTPREPPSTKSVFAFCLRPDPFSPARSAGAETKRKILGLYYIRAHDGASAARGPWFA